MPKHPIAKQTGDIFYAIRTYFRFELEEKPGKNKFKLSKETQNWYTKRDSKLFEIYPFMGLNTQNYTLDELIKLLDKFFKDFHKEEKAEDRKNKLFEKMGMLDSNMYRDEEIKNLTKEEKNEKETLFWNKNHIASDYQHAFAGIKVYPQLGFDPFPEDDSWEFEKVKYLYKYCIDKRIPITTHCSDGGYKTDDNDELTSPSKWKKVLEYKYKDEEGKEIKFENLTLNFAHFGSQKNGKTEWKKSIIELIKKYDNIYTDISCKDKAYYNSLEDDLKDEILQNRILFGSDFSINMLVTGTDSYNENLQDFVEAKSLEHKVNLCERNPERFLFGEISEES